MQEKQPILKCFKNAILDSVSISSRQKFQSVIMSLTSLIIWLVFDRKIKTFWLTGYHDVVKILE